MTSITVTFDDGTILSTSGPFTAVTPPAEIAEVDVVKADGTEEKFAPEA